MTVGSRQAICICFNVKVFIYTFLREAVYVLGWQTGYPVWSVILVFISRTALCLKKSTLKIHLVMALTFHIDHPCIIQFLNIKNDQEHIYHTSKQVSRSLQVLFLTPLSIKKYSMVPSTCYPVTSRFIANLRNWCYSRRFCLPMSSIKWFSLAIKATFYTRYWVLCTML